MKNNLRISSGGVGMEEERDFSEDLMKQPVLSCSGCGVMHANGSLYGAVLHSLYQSWKIEFDCHLSFRLIDDQVKSLPMLLKTRISMNNVIEKN